MNILTRRKVGVLLVAISAVAMVVFLLVGMLRGDWRYNGSGSSDNAPWADYSVKLGVNDYFFIPIILCGMVGAFCLLWPSPKPPKLAQ